MIKLPKSQPAVPLKYKYGVYMGWIAAAILVGFGLIHLFRIDTFLPELGKALPGGEGFVVVAGIAIVVMEVFAVPFLLRMRLSPLASFLSGLFGVLVPLIWLLITVWNYTSGVSTAQFGEFVSSVVTNWLLVANLLWVGYAYLTLWALGFDKAYSPALDGIVKRSKVDSLAAASPAKVTKSPKPKKKSAKSKQ